VKPIAADLLAKARHKLGVARQILDASVPEIAAREAYLAAFSAARALIFETTDKAPKTHAGVRVEFARIAGTDAALGPDLLRFLVRAYDFKQIADYETTGASTSAPEASATIDQAEAFVVRVERKLAGT
jgi:uncharacterized protein (UPF0332 family)